MLHGAGTTFVPSLLSLGLQVTCTGNAKESSQLVAARCHRVMWYLATRMAC